MWPTIAPPWLPRTALPALGLLSLSMFPACWSPGRDATLPELPPLAPDPAAEEGEAGEEPAAEGEEPVEGAAPVVEEGPPFVNYLATTTSAPVTLVDDFGKPLTIISVQGTPVEVRGEDAIRKRVWCESCSPQAEGWAQESTVTDRP